MARESAALGPSDLTSPTRVRDAVRVGNQFLFGALLVTVLLWNVPYGWAVLYPFKLFATWLHESSHGLVMLITGAGFRKMEVFRDTSGLAFPLHGVTAPAQAAISSAGYMGTAFFGALFLVLGHTPRGARLVLLTIALLMGVTAIFFVRNPFGVASVATGGAVLALFAWRAGALGCGMVVNFLAAQSCINAVLDIRVLFGTTMFVDGQPHGQTDAHAVADAIGGPYWVWAALWLVWSFTLFYAALRYVRLRPGRSAAGPAVTKP